MAITYQNYELTYAQVKSPANTVSYKFKIKGIEFDEFFLKQGSHIVTLPSSITNIAYAARQVVERYKGYKSEVFSWSN